MYSSLRSMRSSVLGLLLTMVMSWLTSLPAVAQPPTVNPIPVPQSFEWNAFPLPSRASSLWRLEAYYNGAWVNLNAYEYTRQSKDVNWWYLRYPWTHWTTIGLNGKVRIRATRLARSWNIGTYAEHLTAATVLPSKYGITPVVTPGGGIAGKGTIEFTIEGGQNVYIQTSHGFTPTPPTPEQDVDTLFVFTNPPKPSVDAATMHYFGPGLHTIGNGFVPPGGKKTIYLDHGAWVVGSFDLTDPLGTTGEMRILGPGVLSGENRTWEAAAALPTWSQQIKQSPIHIQDPGTFPGTLPAQRHPITIDGITLVASPWVNIHTATCRGPKRIEHVHILSPWTYNTDAFSVGSKALINNCTVFTNDNQIHSEFNWDGSILVNDCLLAGRAAFLVGYGYFQNPIRGRTVVTDTDLVLQKTRTPFMADMDATSSNLIANNQVYRDIVIQGDVARLCELRNFDTPWGSQTTSALGTIKGVRFENVRINGVQAWGPSIIAGKDANNRIGTPEDPIVFKNLVINGVQVTQQNYTSYFTINQFASVVFE